VLSIGNGPIDLAALVAAGTAQRTDTSYRTIYQLPVSALRALAPAADLDLFARGPADPSSTARMHVYYGAPRCVFEGDPQGRKVLITGFDPFPVVANHDNVSAVAVRGLDPSRLVGAKVLRLILPVEYDGAPAIVADAIQRCSPEVVIDFGQGDDSISLERTAYNLKDTSAYVDNRGRFQAGVPIEAGGPAQRASGLPLDRILAALSARPLDPAIGALQIAYSDDPGRYVCNDTFFGVLGATTGTSTRAGFIHLPYTTNFDDASRAAWGELVRAVVQAAAAN
jgi:pyroglutamyl-peptidase